MHSLQHSLSGITTDYIYWDFPITRAHDPGALGNTHSPADMQTKRNACKVLTQSLVLHLCYLLHGNHLQAAAALAVVQPHIGAAGHVVQRVPQGHHRLQRRQTQASLTPVSNMRQILSACPSTACEQA